MTVKDILTDYLKKNGFDGLANTDCGCKVDDLASCCHDCLDCEPAYNRPDLLQEGYGFWMCPEKAPAPAVTGKEEE